MTTTAKLYRVTVLWHDNNFFGYGGETHEFWVRAENGDEALRLCRDQCMDATSGSWGFQNAEGETPTGLFRSYGRTGWYTGEGTLDSVLTAHAKAFGEDQPAGVLCRWFKPDTGFSHPASVSMVRA